MPMAAVMSVLKVLVVGCTKVGFIALTTCDDVEIGLIGIVTMSELWHCPKEATTLVGEPPNSGVVGSSLNAWEF